MKNTIKSQERISKLFASGRRYEGAGFYALYSVLDPAQDFVQDGEQPCCHREDAAVCLESKAGEGRAGRTAFIAGKKLGTAPARNRAKRRLREAAGAAGAPWEGYDVVFVARQGIQKADFGDICLSVGRLRERLVKEKSRMVPPTGYRTEERPGEETGSLQAGRNEGRNGTAGRTADRTAGRKVAESQTERHATGRKALNFLVAIPGQLAIVCITVYRKAISPLLPPSCRYVPTCSEYALIAFQRFGFWRGLWLSVKRVGRCHPFVPGGYDPVPESLYRKLV